MPRNPLGEVFVAKIRSRNERAFIIGVKTQMEIFYYFYGGNVLQLLLRHKDNLSRSLQILSMAVYEGKNIFLISWEKILIDVKSFNVYEPSLPRKRRSHANLVNEGETNAYFKIGEVKTFYCCIYFDAIDTIVLCMED